MINFKKYLDMLEWIDSNNEYNHSIKIFSDWSGTVYKNDQYLCDFSNEKELYENLSKIKAGIEFDNREQ